MGRPGLRGKPLLTRWTPEGRDKLSRIAAALGVSESAALRELVDRAWVPAARRAPRETCAVAPPAGGDNGDNHLGQGVTPDAEATTVGGPV